MNFDFAMTGADGKELEPVFGPGLTGLKNLGNSCVEFCCYLSSTETDRNDIDFSQVLHGFLLTIALLTPSFPRSLPHFLPHPRSSLFQPNSRLLL